MVFKTGHVSDDQLASLARGEEIDVSFEVHLTQCLACKRRLANALLMKGLIARPADGTEGRHLSAEEINDIHKVLFEGEEASPGELLRRYRHIGSCESCFTAFFNLHTQLSPTSSALNRALVAFTKARAARTIGRVTISRFLGGATLKFSRAVAKFAPEPLSNALLAALSARDMQDHELPSAADAELDSPAVWRLRSDVLNLDVGDFAAPVAQSVSASFPAAPAHLDAEHLERPSITEGQLRRRAKSIEKMLSALGKLEIELRYEADRLRQRINEVDEEQRRLSLELERVAADVTALRAHPVSTNAEEIRLEEAGLKVLLLVGWSGGPAKLRSEVRALESSEPRAGILLTVLSTGGEVLSSATTDELGSATLELHERSQTLRLQSPGKEAPWDIGLDLPDESGR